MNQQAKANLLFELHKSGKMLVLPNIWDSLGAMLLESIGYPVIATAGAAIAFTHGYENGKQVPFADVLNILTRIVACVDKPLTADIETGYSNTNSGLYENIKLLIKSGIVGINFEDSAMEHGGLNSIEVQCEKIRLIREASKEAGIRLFINARTDVYIKQKELQEADKLNEAIKRGKAYRDSGADCIFPVGVNHELHIKEIASQLAMPVNILAAPGIPDLKTLQALGVSRVSLGPEFLKVAIKAMKAVAEDMFNHQDIHRFVENDLTPDYLKGLING